MAGGLIGAGLISGAGNALQNIGAQEQKLMGEKELQAARQSAEDKRQERLIEAQSRQQERGIVAGKETQAAGFGHEEKMEQTRENFAGKMKSLDLWEKGQDRALQARKLDIDDETQDMKKDEVKTIVDANGHVQMFDYTGESKGMMLGEDKQPIVAPKDLPASVLKQVDVNNEKMKALTAELTHGFKTPDREKAIIKELNDLHKQSVMLLTGSAGTPGTPSPIPPYAQAREAGQKGSSTSGPGLLGTIPGIEPGAGNP